MSRRPWMAAYLAGLLMLLTGEMAAVGAILAFPPPLDRITHASTVVLDRNGSWLRALPAEEGRWRLRAHLDQIDPVFLRRLIALEDTRFYWHPGVDPAATTRAAIGDLLTGRVRSGGSTLTMQLARRLDPRPRTLKAKVIEAGRALELEALLGKRQILADYLTLTPYGGDLEGVRAASLAWFGHEPDHLSDGEQALLIALPQAPEARRPDRHPEAARAARSRILGKLQAAGLITADARALANAEALPRREPLPAIAWNAAERATRQGKVPAGADVISTIDAALQTRVEILARETARAQGSATSVAVLVIDVRTRAVRAAVGSAGRDRPGGWIDATRAFRSPGSVLKPFVYAMAFEAGLASPGTRMADRRSGYADYRPRNFDRALHGEVTASDALQQSLNIPAVNMLSAVGPSAFEQRLRAVGVDWRRPKAGLAAPSLALALGGEGVRLEDVAMLYAALADGGLAKPLAWTEKDAATRPGAVGVRLISPDAAHKVMDILGHTPPPAGRAPPEVGGGPALAFKTGTSYGFRDAVAAGAGEGYAVVVWTGRPDGGARPGLTGREAALPLLFDIFDLLSGPRGAPETDLPRRAPDALQTMIRTESDDTPQIIFPPDGARLQVDRYGARAPGLALSAEGQGVRWFVDGAPVAADPRTGQTIWRPGAPGFYVLTAVGPTGERAKTHLDIVR